MFKGKMGAVSLAVGVMSLAAFGSGTVQAAVTEVEGSAGGGLVPWALLHPQGPVVSYTNVSLNDYRIQSLAVGTSFGGMVEASVAKQMVDAAAVGTALGLDPRIDVNVFALKVKVLDMVNDSAVPQIAIGVQSKHASGDIIDALKSGGAIDSKSGTDWYAAITKVVGIGGKKVLLDVTARATKANQFGALGFGGGAAGNNSYKLKPEASIGAFVADNVVLGVEYRAKPNNISAANFGIQEKAAYDLFMAYFVNKNMSITAAYANLGQVGPSQAVLGTAKKQDGLYLQLQSNF